MSNSYGIWKVAWRNLWLHKTKTIIVGILMFLGVVLMVAGNTLLDTASNNKTILIQDHYTADVVIFPSLEEGEAIAPTSAFGGSSDIRPIGNIDEVLGFLDSSGDVQAYSPMARATQVAITFGDLMSPIGALTGVNEEKNLETFPEALIWTEGSMPTEANPGIALHTNRLANLDEALGRDGRSLKVGDTVTITQQGSGIKVKDLVITGAFDFAYPVALFDDYLAYSDLETSQYFSDFTEKSKREREEEKENVEVEDAFAEEDIFGSGDDLFGDSFSDVSETEAFSGDFENDISTLIGDTSERDLLQQVDTSAYLKINVRLADGVAKTEEELNTLISDWNETFKANGIDAQAQSWREEAKGLLQFHGAITFVVSIVALIIAIVVLIVIMNTLVVSVTERVAEVGMIRALGGRRSFIRDLFLYEALSLAIFFGIIGMLFSSIAIGILQIVGLHSESSFFNVLFGGTSVYPILSPSSLIVAFVGIILVGVLSSIYPIRVATRYQPVEALRG